LLEQARENSDLMPDVIFMDLKMPVKNGFEVVEWLRTQSFPKSFTIVVLSGSDQGADKPWKALLEPACRVLAV